MTAEQMREIDRVAVEETGPNLFQMMENAGRSLAETVVSELGTRWASTPVVVAAGTGGNGGGGICAARHLVNRGADVTVIVTDPSRIAGVPAAQLGLYRAAGGRESDLSELTVATPGLVVDALIGYGLERSPSGAPADLVGWMRESKAQVISLDAPTGVDATTGERPGVHVQADVTLTLHLPKTGLDVDPVGRLLLADLGIPEETHRRVGLDVPHGIFGGDWIVELR